MWTSQRWGQLSLEWGGTSAEGTRGSRLLGLSYSMTRCWPQGQLFLLIYHYICFVLFSMCLFYNSEKISKGEIRKKETEGRREGGSEGGGKKGGRKKGRMERRKDGWEKERWVSCPIAPKEKGGWLFSWKMWQNCNPCHGSSPQSLKTNFQHTKSGLAIPRVSPKCWSADL